MAGDNTNNTPNIPINHLTYDRTLEFTEIDPVKQSEILTLAAQGLPIQKIEKQAKISYETIARYAIKDPLFESEWRRARILGADLIADELQSVYDNAETVADAMIGRGKSENIRTLAGWRNPQKYGPKLNIDVQHSVDLTKALQQAEGRTIPILEQAASGFKLSSEPTQQGYPQLYPHVDKSAMSTHQERQLLKDRARLQAEKDAAIPVEVEAVPKMEDNRAVVIEIKDDVVDELERFL